MQFESLIALQDAAMSCGGIARRFVENHSICDFSDRDDWAAESNAVHDWNSIEHAYEELGKYADKFEHHPENYRLLELIKYANANHLNPVTIAGSSYTTSHEAAVGFAHAVRYAIEGAEGETKREMCENLAMRLEPLKQLSDFYGLIEREFLSAELAFDDRTPAAKTLCEKNNKAAVELVIDIPTQRATLRTANSEELFDLPSEGVARWLKVLADHPDEWIRPDAYETHGGVDLQGLRPRDKLRTLDTNCPRLGRLIATSKHDGMRFEPKWALKSGRAPRCVTNR